MSKNLCSQRKSSLGAIFFTINSAQTNMGKTWTSLVRAVNSLSPFLCIFSKNVLKGFYLMSELSKWQEKEKE
jgi:hypothetical protein